MLLEREAERAVWPSPFRLYNQVLLVNTKNVFNSTCYYVLKHNI